MSPPATAADRVSKVESSPSSAAEVLAIHALALTRGGQWGDEGGTGCLVYDVEMEEPHSFLQGSPF